MVEVGDKVKIKAVRNGGDLVKVNDVVTVTGLINNLGFMAVTSSGEGVYVCYDFKNSCADYLAGPVMTETETEAERRGAKFGVTGVIKGTGEKCIYIHETTINPEHWDVVIEGQFGLFSFDPSAIRLGHEPEYVAWEDAPEELKYDASRVYFDGEPVKWIAKPDGAVLTDVVYTTQDGIVRLSSDCLTVKL